MDELILIILSFTENLKEMIECRKRVYKNRNGKMKHVKMNMNMMMENTYIPMVGCDVNFIMYTLVNDERAVSIRMITNDKFHNKDTLIKISPYNPIHFAE